MRGGGGGGGGGVQLLKGSLFHGAMILKYTAAVSKNLHW